MNKKIFIFLLAVFVIGIVAIPFSTAENVTKNATVKENLTGSYNSTGATYNFDTNTVKNISGYCMIWNDLGPAGSEIEYFNVSTDTSMIDNRIKELIVKYYRPESLNTVTPNNVSNKTLSGEISQSIWEVINTTRWQQRSQDSNHVGLRLNPHQQEMIANLTGDWNIGDFFSYDDGSGIIRNFTFYVVYPIIDNAVPSGYQFYMAFTYSEGNKTVPPVEPETPEINETPETPKNNETPVNPETPEDNETPVNPDTPDTPVNPNNPENPVNNSTDENVSDIPVNPESPDTPESPETPINPESPGNPDIPSDNSVTIVDNNSNGNNDGVASVAAGTAMKNTGIPIVALLLVLFAALGIGINNRKK